MSYETSSEMRFFAAIVFFTVIISAKIDFSYKVGIVDRKGHTP